MKNYVILLLVTFLLLASTENILADSISYEYSGISRQLDDDNQLQASDLESYSHRFVFGFGEGNKPTKFELEFEHENTDNEVIQIDKIDISTAADEITENQFLDLAFSGSLMRLQYLGNFDERFFGASMDGSVGFVLLENGVSFFAGAGLEYHRSFGGDIRLYGTYIQTGIIVKIGYNVFVRIGARVRDYDIKVRSDNESLIYDQVEAFFVGTKLVWD